LANTGGVVINSNDSAGNTAQWTFGTDGTTQFPGSMILAPVSQSITMQSDQYSQLMWQNANVTVAPNMATYSNFYVAQNSATLDIGYLDGNSSPQFKSWYWNVDGNLTLPSGGYILNSDNSIYGGSSYSNVEVATYLPTYSGNVANITLSPSGVLTFADGTTQATAASGGGGTNYSNVNVAAYVTTNGLTNYSNVNVKAYTETMGFKNYSNVNVAAYLSTATITTTGNITAANFVGNISITGNVTGTSSNVTLQAGAYTSVFDNQGNVTVPQLFTAGNIQTAGYFVGNGAFLTGIVAGSSYSNVQVATYLPTYSGVVGASNVFVSGNVTAQYFLGNGALLTGIASSYSNVQVAQYLQVGNVANISVAGNVTATYFVGNGALLTGIVAGSSYGNIDVANYLGNVSQLRIGKEGLVFSNISLGINNLDFSACSYVRISTTAAWQADAAIILSASNGNVYVTSGNITTPGIKTDGYYYANGTPVSFGGGSSYSNVNVAAYLTTYGGAIQSSNVQTTTANIQATIAATNPATGALRVMGGAGIAGTVFAAQLNTTGNLIANAVSAYSLNTVANVVASVVNAGTINSSGNVLAQNLIGTIATASQTNITAVGTLATLSVSGNATVGNLIGTEANTRIIANVYTTTFDIYGNVTFPGNIITPTGLYVGPTLATALPNTIAQFTSNANSYAQINFENVSTGTDATADYIATANNGTDTTFFVDLGITNNNYDNASPNNSLGTAVFANDSYLYAQGNLATTTGGNLVIGTSTANKSVKIFAGGINSANIVATVSNTGVAVTGNVSATGNITATGYIVTAGGFGNISQVDTITANTVNSTGNIRVNGNIAVNGPAFGAYANTAVQTITSGSQQKVQFQVEEYDTNSCFANSRFTPTAAGIYQFNAEVRFDGSYGTGESMIVLYKNGAEHKRGWNASGVNWASTLGAMTVSTQAMANGTGDFFEIYVQQTSGGNLNITAVDNPAITWFNGCMLRGL
jgi:hypothetical protein